MSDLCNSLVESLAQAGVASFKPRARGFSLYNTPPVTASLNRQEQQRATIGKKLRQQKQQPGRARKANSRARQDLRSGFFQRLAKTVIAAFQSRASCVSIRLSI